MIPSVKMGIWQMWPRFDWLLILAAFVLFAFGVAAITSVELSQGAAEFVFLRKQLIALALGLILFAVAAGANYQLFRAYGRIFYAAGILLLVVVLFLGRELNGTTGWFIVAGASFQPVEFMKLALAVELARYFSDEARERFGWRELLQSGLRVLLPVLLLLQQPDLGGATILLGIWAIAIFFAGIRFIHIGTMLAVVGLGIGLVLGGGFLEDYQMDRIQTFLNPASDPLESGYNVTQAKIAIGAGGLFGRGLGAGSQSQLRFLPESQTDFVFAVIAEELGLIGVMVVIGAFTLLMCRLLLLARTSRDPFAAYLLITLCGLVFVQSVIHIGVNLAVMPATGVTLPFVSYGGSSLLMMLTLLGVAESVARRVSPVDRVAAAF